MLPNLSELSIEPPTNPLILDLLVVDGGQLSFNTTVAYVINLLSEGLRDMIEGDLVRIAELYHAAIEVMRENQNSE